MNSNLQAEEAIKKELIDEVPLENKTQVVATEQVLVQLITQKKVLKALIERVQSCRWISLRR